MKHDERHAKGATALLEAPAGPAAAVSALTGQVGRTGTGTETLSSFEMGKVPGGRRMSREVYDREKVRLQQELMKAQRWIEETGQRVVTLFEGRDAAGKGGTIKRFMEHLNPRTARVVALTKPTERETTQWYFQRYISQLPVGGELCLFDRSWYNRAGVERVMGFCTPQRLPRVHAAVPRGRADAGALRHHPDQVLVLGDPAGAARRFAQRMKDPLKQWKLSPIDLASLDKWDEYTEAKEAMFFYTDTADAPWTIVKSDDKKRARINCLQHFLATLPYPNKDHDIVTGPDPLIVGAPRSVLGEDGRWVAHSPSAPQ